MLTLTPPAAVGLDPNRLANIGPHLDRYVDDGSLPGYMVMVARRGRPAYLRLYGQRDVERGLPVQEDTIFRIYSMTKPITSVALLQLYEKGLFQLDNPVSRFIPAFKDLQVYTGGDGDNLQTVTPDREVTIRDLFTHTAGFTYGNNDAHPVERLYQQRNMRQGTLADMVQKLSTVPLLFAP
ncbi:MAG: beta-lactamase family protein, partial [Anaerolineales bacterium]|nr:beta-lactamase family protein [Anaerolineales bacterium]